MTKKIALQLSGQPRSYKEAYPYIKKNLLDLYDVDVFYHTWKKDPTRIDADDLYQLYQPKRHVDGTPGLIKDDVLNKRYSKIGDNLHPPCNTVNMFYSIWIANFLRLMHEKTENVNYDWVIRCRFDYALNLKLDFLNALEPYRLYTPYEPALFDRQMVTDQFAIANPGNMTKYSSVFLNLDEIVNRTEFPHGGSGEDILSSHLGYLDFFIEDNVNHQYIDMNHPFPPGEFNGTPHSLIREDFREWNKIR